MAHGLTRKRGQTINALLSLKSATPPSLHDEPMAYSPSARIVEVYDMPSSQILQRGQRFFDKVYGKVSKRVMGQMDRSGTEDLGVVARLMYGYLLSNTRVLSPMESSFVLLAGLIPQDVSVFLFVCRFCYLKKNSHIHSVARGGRYGGGRSSVLTLRSKV